MSSITKEQIEELINLRLSSIGLKNYEGCISDINDPIINWCLILMSRTK